MVAPDKAEGTEQVYFPKKHFLKGFQIPSLEAPDFQSLQSQLAL